MVTSDLSVKGSQREADQFDLLPLSTFIKDQDERGRNPRNSKVGQGCGSEKNKENVLERSVAWSGNEYTKSSTWKIKVKTAEER